MHYKFFVLLLVFSCGSFNDLVLGQTSNKSAFLEIEDSLAKAERLLKNEKGKQAHEIYLKIIELSEKSGYSKGKAEGYYGAAASSFPEGNRTEATRMLLLAEDEDYAKDNPALLSKIYFQLGLNLHTLKMNDDSKRKYFASIKLAEKVKDVNVKSELIVKNQLNIGDLQQRQGNYDSALYYYRKSFNSTEKNIEIKLVSSLSLAEVFIIKKQMDSVPKYMKLSNQYVKEVDSFTYSAMVKSLNGVYHFEQGNYEIAIKEFKESERLFAEVDRTDPTLYTYLSKSYTKINQIDSANYYLQKNQDFEESYQLKKINNYKVPLLINEKEKKVLKKNHLVFNIVMFAGSFVIVTIALFLIFKQRRKNLKNTVENKNLKKQLNVAFDEIVELAKTNSPHFLARFIEVYPEFHSTLLKIQPALTNSDLTMCAYIKLDFSTKEIASFTFSSFRTVQNRKYRIRKKLNLESKVDLNKWLQNL